jgi:hypothetical protein
LYGGRCLCDRFYGFGRCRQLVPRGLATASIPAPEPRILLRQFYLRFREQGHEELAGDDVRIMDRLTGYLRLLAPFALRF